MSVGWDLGKAACTGEFPYRPEEVFLYHGFHRKLGESKDSMISIVREQSFTF